MECTDFFRITERHKAEFATADTLRDFAYSLDASKPGDGRVLQHIAEKYPESWERYFRTIKVHGFVSRPLAMPEARKVSDVFKAVSLYPMRAGGGYRGDSQAERAGAVFVSALRAPGFAYFGQLGAVYGWAPRFAPGEVRAILKAPGTWLTGAIPTDAVCEALGAKPGTGEYDLAAFEAVQWDDGRVLLLARDHLGIGSRWVAVLDAGESALPLLSDHERGEIEAEYAAQREAWGEDKRPA